MADVLIPASTLEQFDELAKLQPMARKKNRHEADEWPALKPLHMSSPARADAFPFDALGAVLGEAARAIGRDVQAPDALAGGSVLAAASLAASPLANVQMPHGQIAPLSLFIITGAASGDRKSATDAAACLAIEERRKQHARDHIKAMQRWETENAGRPKADKAPPPMAQVLAVSNATVEGLTKLLKHQSSVGVFSAEGGEMLGGHSMREERRVSGLSFYLKAWGAEPLDSLRGGEGLTVLLGRRVALHVLVQPVILAQLLADPMAQGQGLLARCLIAQPDTLAGSRLFRDSNPLENPAVVRFNNRIRTLLDQTPRVWNEGDGFELRPTAMHMTTSARAMWVEFFNQVEQAQSPGGELAGARAFASKAAEQAARIAGVVAVVEGRTSITDREMEGGIEVATFYMGEHLRLTGAGRTDQRNAQLRMLFDWMAEVGPFVITANVLQRSPRQIRKLKAEGIKDLLGELAERGYIREAATPGSWEVRDVQS